MGNNSTKHRNSTEKTPCCLSWVGRLFRSRNSVAPEPADEPAGEPQDEDETVSVSQQRAERQSDDGPAKSFNSNDIALEDIEEHEPKRSLSPIAEETLEELYEDDSSDESNDDEDEWILDTGDFRCLSPTPPKDQEYDTPDIYDHDDQRPISALARATGVVPGCTCPNDSTFPMQPGARFNPAYKSQAYLVPVTFGLHIDEAQHARLEMRAFRMERYWRMMGLPPDRPTVKAIERIKADSGGILILTDATEFLQIKDILYSRLGELKDTEIDTRPHNKADMKFHSHKMLDAFQKFSSKLGEVWSSTAFIPNTKIQTYDIGLGREETAMLITLHDYEKRPLAEPGVDIRVEVTNPVGKKSRAHVIDMTDTEGAYKVIYQGTKLGDHTASVFVLGIPVIDPAIAFKVRRPGALEEDILRDFDAAGMHPPKPKLDKGSVENLHQLEERRKVPQLSGLDMDDGEDHKQRVKSYRVFGDIICPDFSYDITTCHPQNMVTADARTLKNVRGRATNMSTALKNYRGAIGTKPFGKLGRFYFEVVVYFFIKRQLRNDLIFEVALARKPEVDRNYTVDGLPSAWTVCARRCPLCRTVCLMTFHNGVRLYHNPLTENSPPGTTLRTTIGFLVDTKAKQWYIVDAKNRRLFFRFKNIDTSKPLWPVFGAYCTEYVSVSLALKTGKDVQAVPDIPADV